MLKKQLVHLEFYTILYLISLPFVLHFFESGNFFYLIVLAFLDATYVYLIDENYLQKQMAEHAQTIMQNPLLRRVGIYVLGIIVGTVVVGFKSFPLFLILLANQLALSLLSRLKVKWSNHHKRMKM